MQRDPDLARRLKKADRFAARSGPLTAAIVQEPGLQPPGATVRLKSGDHGIVMRRGEKASTPVVAAATAPARALQVPCTPGR
jgi:hypothetical protein